MQRYFTKTFFAFLIAFLFILALAFGVAFVAAGWQTEHPAPPAVTNTAANG